MKAGMIATMGGVAAVWLGGTVAGAQPVGPGPGGPPEGPPLLHATRLLRLSAEQQEAAREIFDQKGPEMRALREQMRENHERLRERLDSDHPDPLAVGEVVIEGHALRERGRRLHEEAKAALETVLTPEQRLKLEALEAVRTEMGPGGPHARKGSCGRAWNPPDREPEDVE